MIDFVEYVVAELKSRRLSKEDAAALVRQFSRRTPRAAAARIHPLLHRNTSDLSEQRYESTFTGEEQFLADHQVAGRKLLPGVAYLEMARAAVEEAWPVRPDGAVLELHNTVWAQPIVVDGSTQVGIALSASGDGRIDFEIYRGDVVHCQGSAAFAARPAPAPIEIEQLQRETAALDPDAIYAACARMGIAYGPSFRTLAALQRGTDQVVAQLRLQADDIGDYVLHPSLADGATQAAVALVMDGAGAEQQRLPFALETLRIAAPCTAAMFAWLRYAPGSRPTDSVVKLDIDLCDEQGRVCVEMRGFSWREQGRAMVTAPVVAEAAIDVADKTQDYLRRQFSALLKLPPQQIDPRAPLENYGIDSILAMKLTSQLETAFGSLPKTLFFEYQTINALAEYFNAHYAAQLHALLAPAAVPAPVSAPAALASKRRRGRARSVAPIEATSEPIAIIGLSGRYPQAVDLDAYWANLRDGKDCITEVPKERWDWREFFSEDRNEPGRHFSKWGGFIAGVDEFDPLFFNISPVDAELIDPQERLFLQHTWMAVEDAGYSRAGLPEEVGVYAGVMYNEYPLFAAESGARGKPFGVPGSVASIANRVSYLLNLHGPSMTLDTMCSSSLTAIHLACQDLKQRRVSMAIAGGVNVSIHPNKYLVLSAGQFISGDGHCQSFGEGGDGYIPGEGVGVVVLKRLSEAERDGDRVYGVIRGSALNHGGKTNGYSVPNPQAQTAAIARALAESHTDARHVSYIEAHGTGTKLGDPIEIAALSKAFQQSTPDTAFCRIGSVKSNIGHCESAAGIAGLTKVLLQLQHRQIVPSLHAEQLNPHIDFAATPFVVNQSLREWEQPVIDGRTLPRIAGISSFGAGGSNAHMIVEEFEGVRSSLRSRSPVETTPQPRSEDLTPVAVMLSARTAPQLQQKARDLLDFVRPRLNTVDLPSMAYTLQVGRDAMEHRLGLVVRSAEQLVEKLESWLSGEQGIEDAYHGQQKRNNQTLSLFSTDADLQQAIERWIDHKKLSKLLELWVEGLDLDWAKLYGDARPRRMGLPAYPFAKERYWVETAAPSKRAAVELLHPLLHRNASDLSAQRYRSTFTGDEFFLADHRVAGEKLLPGVACLEMARAAIAHAVPERTEVPELRDVVWVQPIVVATTKDVGIALFANDDEIEFEIDGDDETVYCQGRAVFGRDAAPAPLDLEQLARDIGDDALEPDAVYAACAGMGLSYGPSFRGLTAIRRGRGQALARLRLPESVERTSADYVLHPSLLDGALQAAVALIDAGGRPRVPFAFDSLRVFAPCPAEMVAWLREASGKLDVDLCDAAGNVCVQLRGVSSRVMSAAAGTLLAVPVWERGEALAGDFAERHVISLRDVPGNDLAERYTECAVVCFERLQAILRSKPRGNVLVQLVVDDPLLAGLSGLLKTAALENPLLSGELVVGGVPQLLRWQEVAAPPDAPPIAFKDGCVYLITGGTGGLGTLFAREIAERAPGARVIAIGRRQVDLGDLDQVTKLVAAIRDEHGRLDGILHCAGMIADAFILKKSSDEFRAVLAPKVTGTFHLDQATKDVELDFFVLFSSIVGATGNVGQADYAAANGFLDRFAAHRNALVAAGQRHGRTRSINWPLWQAGGMTLDPASRELLQQATGMRPMQTATGMTAFHRALALPHDQLLVVEGDLARIRRVVLAAPAPQPQVEPATVAEPANLAEKTEEYLRKQLAGLLKLPSHKIDPQAALEEYGIDSILAMKLTGQLEKTFGSLPKTLFFEYQTIHALGEYFVAHHAAQLSALLTVTAAPAPVPAPAKVASGRRFQRARKETTEIEPIAIIGLSGRYPQAIDLDAFWNNLRDGKDCITEVPKERWEWREFFSEDRSKSGRHFSKWGGFIAGVDEFDPLFFNISPLEAQRIDPQERLFLQHTWMAVEDAGYTRASLPGEVGVYAGVMYDEYQLFGSRRVGVPGSTASIANRVSYVLNLHGPSVTLDTMCSSSLTAIHFACEDLKRGRTALAIAGGVNVSIHPNKYLVLSAGQFISSDGHCQSFGEGGDGYIPGEGVGVVVLKRLSDAKRDGDHLYGVIRGSALNHGGKTNGYTVPNPQAQAGVIARALAESHTDPRHVSYIEAHGTGTKLGDPIEIAALTKAFQQSTQDTGFCRVGSVKSNIGHCESAAGIAALTKVLLQLQHRQIVPSLHSAQLNPHIDFPSTPFVVNQELCAWEPPVIDGRTLPRIAGISSFGAGGSNAHVVVEEVEPPPAPAVAAGPVVIVLSARTPEQLQEKARDLLRFLDRNAVDLAAMAYTLQVGREAMEHRLGLVASSAAEVAEKLRAYVAGEPGIDELVQGEVRRGNDALSVFSADADLQQTVGKWIANRKLARLVELWVKGLDVDWSKLYDARPRRISLPVYPFAKERYWIEPPERVADGAAFLHPLLHSNTSDLSEQRYRSTFTGDEFVLADHRVRGEKLLPAVAYLEMARAAIDNALPERPESLELRNVVWAQPIVVAAKTDVGIALSANDDGQIAFEIDSGDTVHCEGLAVASDEAPAALDLERLDARMDRGSLEPADVYAALTRMGLEYGPAFQAIASIRRGAGEVLARLRLPKAVEETAGDYVLHPSLMDGALQAAAGLLDDVGGETRLPFALESLRIAAPCTPAMVAWVRYAGRPEAIDVDLCDERGNVCAQLRGLSSRVAAQPRTVGSLLAAPLWQSAEIDVSARKLEFAEHHVIALRDEPQRSLAESYGEHAITCLERVQIILRSKPQAKVLLQVVVTDPLLAGLSGLLKTAALENRHIVGQLLVVPAAMPLDELRRIVDDEKSGALDPLVRYERGARQVLRWQEIVPPPQAPPIAFRDGGVYLITGGRGGLGRIFTQEILDRTRSAQVIVTGRAENDIDLGDRVHYRRLDLGDVDQVRELVAAIRAEYGTLSGILHSAGMLADSFLLNKSEASFRDVMAPKVTGTFHLDEATKDVELDFFALFSSAVGVTGNVGQADHAAANGFMDHFAAYRNALVSANERHGRTRSINWPLWQATEGYMEPAAREALQQTTGVQPLQTAAGIEAFYRSLALPHDQMLVVEGDVAQIRRSILAQRAAPAETPVKPAAAPAESLAGKLQDWLRAEFSAILKLPSHKIDPQAALEQYGIDSIVAMALTNQLEKTFGELSRTLFFEYQTIAALAGYFLKEHAAVVQTTLGVRSEAPVAIEAPRPAPRRTRTRFAAPKPNDRGDDVAIVGLAGRYPHAENLRQFWRNLQNGRDCIREIPPERWDHAPYFDPDPSRPGKSYSKWGGFIDDVDKFDPLFFNISPKEAAMLDPQERLFLETAWETFEDAGYTKERLAGGRVGVFVGVMWGEYQLFGPELMASGSASFPGSSHSSIANRVSYFFDLHGPSIGIDTMCSSSLTAIHLACEAIKRGDVDAAIAGGVNVSIHPYKYLNLSQGKWFASDGRCRAFGAGGDGYVPGEGAGAVLLKPLAQARRDGDPIYAVIKASALNHGGKTNGYTVPNPNAQGDLILETLRKAGIDPRTLSYVESHGTGTSLGDPIEITGLIRAFEGFTDEKQFCAIGSVKSNIGHLEGAAGIASVTKALLQMRHGQLVPSLHAEPLNPNINFANSPFYVQTALAEWPRPSAHPRRAAVSSFGAGGANAHLILEEVVDAQPRSAPASSPELFVLSARDVDALRRYAGRIAELLAEVPDISLADLAYTSQIGRTPMDARLAIVATSVEELRKTLDDWLALRANNVVYGNAKEGGAGNLIEGAAGKAFLDALMATGDLEKIARLWVSGAGIDWSLLPRSGNPRRISLPTYPFAKERCWFERAETEQKRRNTYLPQWVPKPLARRDEAAPIGPILILDDSEELTLALKERRLDVVLAEPGTPFDELVDRRPSVVLHRGAEGGDVAQQLDRGLYSLFRLCGAFVRAKHPVRIMSIFSGDPVSAAIGGFFKTLTLEQPAYRTKIVDAPDANVDLILDELADDNASAEEIRYRDGTRYVRRLIAAPERRATALPLRQHGVYLITGGLGGLGLIFAEYLAKNYRARLILVGRSAPRKELKSLGAEVLVLQGDVGKREDVERIVREAKARFAKIDGVIHAAGVNRDAFLLRKTAEEIDAVLAAKVFGTIHLDQATRDEDLDFFAMFSSIAGVLGNVGQSDYAYASRFLDAFAEHRARTRSGRTLSIDWPLWEEGGMAVARDDAALLETQTGIAPMPTAEGIRYWEDFLASDAVQGVALYGVASKIAAFVGREPVKAQRSAPIRVHDADPATLAAATEAYLKALIGDELKLAPDRIGSADPLESFGIDSVMINRINAQLDRDLGSLPKTLLYEHETIRDLAAFLLRERRDALTAKLGEEPAAEPAVIEVVREEIAPIAKRDEREGIAIIGVHGIYPHSATLAEYWDNLKHGRDLIDPVPPNRWDGEALYDPDPAAAADGKIYCKWGGFLDDHDKFDPHFFKISTAEARLMDPQERLFLESVWAAIEDAGYTRERLRARFGKAGSADVGVFVGVTTNSYQLWAPEERSRGNFVAPAAMPWSIANRVSYFFDFNGPSLPVDTACSSSLVAIHLACESLANGECQLAVAGGVNLYLHPAKYELMCQRRMLALGGTTYSFGAGDDGFVPGEGVGTVVLKPLTKAIEDGDPIYAVIRASAFDHSGRSNGYSAPNPNAQRNLIGRVLEKAGVPAESIGYVEGHGTGTQLGDSIEVAALTQAFHRETARRQFCPIGSVKANAGHAESAAGMASLAKVLLQLEHRQLAPSIHCDAPNPNIDFDDSPFYLQRGLAEWPSPPHHPRRALINSFGAGGVNACLIVEEFERPAVPHANAPYLFSLSAKNEERLRDYADRLLAHLHNDRTVDLAALCYTLQTGREAMEERLAFVVADVDQLLDRLENWDRADVHRGTLDARRGAKRGAAKLAFPAQSASELAARWVAGDEVEWESLYAGKTPTRISLPTYPFARERYWFSDAVVPGRAAPAGAPLHPLIAYNASTLKEVSFSSSLSETAFYAVDHSVNDEPIFPGAGFLEMACIAGNLAGERRVRKITDIVWMQPLSFRSGARAVRTVLRPAGDSVQVEISSFDDDNETVVHAEGRLVFADGRPDPPDDDRVAVDELKAQCTRVENGAACYDKFREHGLQYGRSFQTIQELYVNGSSALAKLRLADHLKADFGEFLLHPSIVDGALQSIAGIVGQLAPSTPHLPFAVDEIEIVRAVPQVCYAYAELAERTDLMTFNVRLLNESGELLVKFRNLYVRPLAKPLARSEAAVSVA